MARHIAKNEVRHSGKVFKPGETVTGLTEVEMAELEAADAVEVALNTEPSVRDDVATWRDYLVEQGILSAEKAAGMSKQELFIAYAADEESEDVAASIVTTTDESPGE